MSLRGWEFPQFPAGSNEFQRGGAVEEGWEAVTDWPRHRELWRLTRTGQFIHYSTLWEDAEPEEQAKRTLDVSRTICTLLEIAEFARRLTNSADYGAAFDLEVALDGLKGRTLSMSDPMRMVGGKHTATTACVELRRTLGLPFTEQIARSAARDLASEVFDTFDYYIPPRFIEDIQSELLQRT